ncbi:MAG TPA: YdcF family protein [Rhodospirillales bacterium]|nr:YdcF family protein [Rhodospirillales bacterium]
MKTKLQGRRLDFRKILLGLLAGLTLAAVTWGVGLFRFAAAIPIEVRDKTTQTGAIVVLTGGSGRLSEGLELLAAKMAGKLFISGVYLGVDVNKLLELSQRAPEGFECCVEIGHSADDTTGNAAETAAWARRRGVNSIRIVTSNYHMPRSLLEFRQALPEAAFIPHPVFSRFVKRDRWWAWPGTASLIVGEYNKFLLVWLRLRAGKLLNLGGSS